MASGRVRVDDAGMARRPHTRPDRVEVPELVPGESDVVEVGRPGPIRPRWPVALGAVAALIAGAVVVFGSTDHKAATSRPSAGAGEPAQVTAISPVSTYDVGHRLLGVTGRWDVFGLGAGVLVRIQPARGRVTVTQLPGGAYAVATSMIALPGRVAVRPVGSGAGYSVADGRVAVPLSNPRGPALDRFDRALSHGGPVFPGPAPVQVWVQTSPPTQDATVMTLVGADGRAIGAPVQVPGDGYLFGDGMGHVIYTTRVDNVYYVTSPGRWRVRTTGQLLAVGANRVVSAERDRRLGLRTVVTDVPDGSRRTFAGPGFAADPVLGTVSPDGRTAAVLTGGFHATAVVLLDLRTGIERDPTVAVAGDASSVTWSPDGRWLFAATAGGRVVAIDARTATVHPLGVTLPPLTQLLVRPASAR